MYDFKDELAQIEEGRKVRGTEEPIIKTAWWCTNCLVFVEVRTKRSLEFGSPEESITPVKMERLRTCAHRYRQEHSNLPSLWRIDVVAVELDRNGKPLRKELIENAVGDV